MVKCPGCGSPPHQWPVCPQCQPKAKKAKANVVVAEPCQVCGPQGCDGCDECLMVAHTQSRPRVIVARWLGDWWLYAFFLFAAVPLAIWAIPMTGWLWNVTAASFFMAALACLSVGSKPIEGEPL